MDLEQQLADEIFGQDEIEKAARLALEAVRAGSVPADRSFKWHIPDKLNQEWIDDVVLRAHVSAPVWSDYALVKTRPDIWVLAYFYLDGDDERLVLVADDSFVVVSAGRIQTLITTTPIAVEKSIYYQISLHSFCINPENFFDPVAFRSLAMAHGLLAYPDSKLIDLHELRQGGNGAEAYIADEERTRPVFIFRRQTHLSSNVKSYQRAAQMVYSSYGPIITNDDLFNRYRHILVDDKFGSIAIAPNGQVIPIERDTLEATSTFTDLLDCCDINAPPISSVYQEIGSHALTIWSAHGPGKIDIELLREGSEEFKKRVNEFHSQFAEASKEQVSSQLNNTDEDQSQSDPASFSQTTEWIKPLEVDADGYPIEAADIPRWADEKLADRIIVVPRARRAIAKSRHPEPARIAQALEVLAGPKLRGYKGESGTVAEFEAGLLKLRMRDGFSNAERLKGQSGEDYILEHGGRRVLLERHLCSNSSGFNDPKMIRIYYVYDKVSQKILIGWLPSHLRTSKS